MASLRLGTLNIGLGFSRKLAPLLTQCASLSLDAIALQEIGDPALLSSRVPPYHLLYAAGPSHHEAGVGLLLSLALLPCIRSHRRSSSGRLVGVVLELHKGHQLLLVSAYMPTGLDHSAAGSEKHELARHLYDEIRQWSADMQQVIVMGDLNETLTHFDRLPRPAGARAAAAHLRPIACMQAEGFSDVWRTLHPDASLQPGFTHVIDGKRETQSRLDYLYVKGSTRADLLQVHISTALHALSHHHLLWMELQLPHAVPRSATPLAPVLRLPNLRDLSEQQRDAFSKKIEQQLEQHQRSLSDAIAHSDSDSLSSAASHLTALVLRCAHATLPLTGSKLFESRCILQLQRQRRDLTRLLRVSSSLLCAAPDHLRGHAHCLTQSMEWRRIQQHCIRQHQLQWTIDAQYCGDAHAWMDETQLMLSRTRSIIRQEQHRMMRERKPPLDASPAAYVHRMLKSDALPSQLLSVVDRHGQLTRSADELSAVMVDHFRSVFAVPADDAAPLPHPVPAMLLDKDSVRPEWYDGLLADVHREELLATIASLPLMSAPGQDEVSSGLWKLALQSSGPLCELVCALFSACLRTSIFPAAWKTSIIVPLLKDPQKERAMSNVRPISLQSCLGKLLNKLLAHRLGHIFASHPILHRAQRGFINGGTITKCIDELLDAWDWSRSGKHELYTLLYDIKQAYDSVQVGVLERALHRLRLPAAFVALVVDSLTGLSSCVRTAYGLSISFDVERSLRQGDPLAPLLFVILLDALHDGLERNPFDSQQHGLRMPLGDGVDVSVPSLGYADDTSALTNTLAAMRIQNDWVHYFMSFNRMKLNSSKCELIGRTATGEPVDAAALLLHGISIEGHALQPVAHDQAIRYLGVHARFDGDWSAQQKKSIAKIAMYSRAITKFRVTLKQAVYVFNTFLMPALELALHYVHGPGSGKWIKQCDGLLIACIRHAAGSLLQLSHSAVALSLGLLLPSWLEISVKVSELFLRMNDSDARWGHLGRMLMRQSLPAVIDSSTRDIPRGNSGTRLSRAARLTVGSLQWSLHLAEQHRPSSRLQRLFDTEPLASVAVPDLSLCSAAPRHRLDSGSAMHLPQDLWRGWGADIASEEVHTYTDGSFDSAALPHPASSWAVTVADEWLHGSYAGIPTDEQLVAPHHVAGAALMGASISCTRGIYPAELQAIARTLAMFPTSFALHVHSDSQASLAGIRAFESTSNERARLRVASRPLLQLINHLLRIRNVAGGSVAWHHVRAHTAQADLHSVGNRLSDYQANRARLRPDVSKPLGLRELPLHDCEPHLHMRDERTGLQLIDDIRRSALTQLQASALNKWQSRIDDRSQFAGDAVMQLGRTVLRLCSAEQQRAFLHLATNSIHYHLVPSADGSDKEQLAELHCAACNATLSAAHLTVCQSAVETTRRLKLQRDIIALLSGFSPSADWAHQYRAAPLSSILLSLFPMPAAVAASRPLSAERHRHLSFALCGVVSTRQLNAAARAVGFTSPLDVPSGRRCMHQLQLLCVDSVQRLFADLKSRAAVA